MEDDWTDLKFTDVTLDASEQLFRYLQRREEKERQRLTDEDRAITLAERSGVDFQEAALLLASTANLYARKVDNLKEIALEASIAISENVNDVYSTTKHTKGKLKISRKARNLHESGIDQFAFMAFPIHALGRIRGPEFREGVLSITATSFMAHSQMMTKTKGIAEVGHRALPVPSALIPSDGHPPFEPLRHAKTMQYPLDEETGLLAMDDGALRLFHASNTSSGFSLGGIHGCLGGQEPSRTPRRNVDHSAAAALALGPSMDTPFMTAGPMSIAPQPILDVQRRISEGPRVSEGIEGGEIVVDRGSTDPFVRSLLDPNSRLGGDRPPRIGGPKYPNLGAACPQHFSATAKEIQKGIVGETILLTADPIGFQSVVSLPPCDMKAAFVEDLSSECFGPLRDVEKITDSIIHFAITGAASGLPEELRPNEGESQWFVHRAIAALDTVSRRYGNEPALAAARRVALSQNYNDTNRFLRALALVMRPRHSAVLRDAFVSQKQKNVAQVGAQEAACERSRVRQLSTFLSGLKFPKGNAVALRTTPSSICSDLEIHCRKERLDVTNAKFDTRILENTSKSRPVGKIDFRIDAEAARQARGWVEGFEVPDWASPAELHATVGKNSKGLEIDVGVTRVDQLLEHGGQPDVELDIMEVPEPEEAWEVGPVDDGFADEIDIVDRIDDAVGRLIDLRLHTRSNENSPRGLNTEIFPEPSPNGGEAGTADSQLIAAEILQRQKESESRMRKWNDQIPRFLEALNKEREFDVTEYKEKVLHKCGRLENEEGGVEFNVLTRGKTKQETCRLFLTTLLLTTRGALRLQAGDEGSFMVEMTGDETEGELEL